MLSVTGVSLSVTLLATQVPCRVYCKGKGGPGGSTVYTGCITPPSTHHAGPAVRPDHHAAVELNSHESGAGGHLHVGDTVIRVRGIRLPDMDELDNIQEKSIL